METIELALAPTWAGALPALLAAFEAGTSEGCKLVHEELGRMAQAADRYNELAKAVGAVLASQDWDEGGNFLPEKEERWLREGKLC